MALLAALLTRLLLQVLLISFSLVILIAQLLRQELCLLGKGEDCLLGAGGGTTRPRGLYYIKATQNEDLALRV